MFELDEAVSRMSMFLLILFDEEIIKVDKSKTLLLFLVLFAFAITGWAQQNAPLSLSQSTPLPELHDGDFDHFTVDIAGSRLFSTAEENSKVLVFDLKTNKLIHTISDLKAPHSMLYRADLKKLFVVDGDLGEIKIYETDSYKPVGSIKLREGADASVYDPSTKYLYVVNGGKDAHLPNSYISVIDTNTAKALGEMKVDSNDVEGMALEKSGPRMFVDIRGNNSIEVFDRTKRNLIATWSIAQVAKKPTAISLDEDGHRLFVGARDPGKLIVVDTESGKIVTSVPAAAMVDDMSYDQSHKRLYFAGTLFIDVFQQRDADHYDQIGHIPTSFRAKTAILVPELNRYYLAVPHHENQTAELRVYAVQP
ncbi:MAG TPA: YncE family protein [Pyrinomonadaceae bacterium]